MGREGAGGLLSGRSGSCNSLSRLVRFSNSNFSSSDDEGSGAGLGEEEEEEEEEDAILDAVQDTFRPFLRALRSGVCCLGPCD